MYIYVQLCIYKLLMPISKEFCTCVYKHIQHFNGIIVIMQSILFCFYSILFDLCSCNSLNSFHKPLMNYNAQLEKNLLKGDFIYWHDWIIVHSIDRIIQLDCWWFWNNHRKSKLSYKTNSVSDTSIFIKGRERGIFIN
jgi:hypothetical protein